MGAYPHDDDTRATREGMPSPGIPGLVEGRDAREWTPDDLQVAGLVPMSTVDWSGRFAASLFLQGRSWAYPYCHNSAIIDPRIPDAVAQRALEDLLTRRRGLLDSVVFPGDEATRQIALGTMMARVYELGFGVSLHTTESYPRRLKELFGAGLVDWVGINTKATQGSYEAVAECSGAGERAWESLNIVLTHPEVDHKIRLTVYPDSPGDSFEVAARARKMGVRVFALQQARDVGTSDGFSATRPGWNNWIRSLARGIEAPNFKRFIFRGDSQSIYQVTVSYAGNKYEEGLTCGYRSRHCITTS